MPTTLQRGRWTVVDSNDYTSVYVRRYLPEGTQFFPDGTVSPPGETPFVPPPYLNLEVNANFVDDSNTQSDNGKGDNEWVIYGRVPRYSQFLTECGTDLNPGDSGTMPNISVTAGPSQLDAAKGKSFKSTKIQSGNGRYSGRRINQPKEEKCSNCHDKTTFCRTSEPVIYNNAGFIICGTCASTIGLTADISQSCNLPHKKKGSRKVQAAIEDMSQVLQF